MRVLLLNLVVAIAKIAFGYASGAISILSDGFHSLTDAASNVVGLIGVRAARQPPDAGPSVRPSQVRDGRRGGGHRVPVLLVSSRCCATPSTT